MKDANNLELFQRYLHQQMDAQEKGTFEQLLADDPDFAAQWRFFQMAAHAVKEKHRVEEEANAFREQLKSEGFFKEVHRQIRKEMEAKQQNPPAVAFHTRVSPRVFQWAMAAVLVGLAFGLWMLNNHARETAIARIINTHLYAPYGTYGLSEPGDDTLRLAQQLFQEKKFDQALALLDAKKSGDEEFRLLHARIQLAKGDPQKCLAETEALLGERIFTVTRWNLQLLQAEAYTQNGDKTQAESLLKAFIATEGDNPNKEEFRNTAQDLLKKL